MVQDFEYGLRNGKIVSAKDVESGIGCNCYCPSCGNPFVAYKGKILRPHFKHLAEVNCKYSFETSLHYMAKEIIQQKKYLDLPFITWELPRTLSSWFSTKADKKPLVKSFKWQRVYFNEIEVEKPEGNFKPDLKCYTAGKLLLVEITVTHGIDDEKLQKVRHNDVPLLEIDLSSYKHSLDRKSFKKILYPNTESEQRSKLFNWIHNPKIQNLFSEKQQDSFRIFEFLQQNHRLIKLYGRNRDIYHCPLLEKANTPQKYVDTCKYCTYNLGKAELKNKHQQNLAHIDWAVMCIGHKKYHLQKLFSECGTSFHLPASQQPSSYRL